MQEQIIQIDGSLHQGGGQIIRNSITLATLFNRKVKFVKVRHNRPNPGFNKQLISIFKCFSQNKPKQRQQQFTFIPSLPSYQQIRIDSAGATTLVAQTIMPLILLRKAIKGLQTMGNRSSIIGGTLVSHSPPVLAYNYIITPLLQKMGVILQVQEVKRGYYPIGDGQLRINIDNSQKYIQPISLQQPTTIQTIVIEVILCKKIDISKQVDNLIQKIVDMIQQYQWGKGKKIKVNKKVQLIHNKKFNHVYSVSCFLLGENIYKDCTVHSDEKSTSIREIFQQLIQRVKQQLSVNTNVDSHTQDQLLVFMALAKGISNLRIGKLTQHSLSAIHVIEKFTKSKIDIKQNQITIEGIGLPLQQ